MSKDIQRQVGELCAALAGSKRSVDVRRLLLQLCADSEVAELGWRFLAIKLLRRRRPLDEIVGYFPGRADIVARVVMHRKEYRERIKRGY